MAFNAYGFKTVTHIGSVDGSAGSNRALHAYVTNDDKAAIETAGYFNSLSDRLKVGDIILASADMDGTPALYGYVVSSNAAGVVGITLGTATAAT